MSNRRPTVFARVEPEFRELVRSEAAALFEGNESLLVRDAIRVYLRLRRHLGAAFEPTIQSLTGSSGRVEPARKEEEIAA
jgi:hypothetical protein